MRVFVYGTLTDPDRVATVLDDFAFVGPATLEGCHRVEGTYPTLAPGGRVRGRLLETTEIDTLDAYEGADRDLYVRVAVPLRGRSVARDRPGPGGRGSKPGERGSDDPDRVSVYVGDPALLFVDEPVDWPGDGSFPERVERYVREESVSVRVET